MIRDEGHTKLKGNTQKTSKCITIMITVNVEAS